MLKIFNRIKKEESGQALILVALMLAILMGFAALVVDVGMMYSQRTSLQAAADAAALAGAQDLPDNVKAVKSAVYIAGKNGVLASETDSITPYNGDSKKIEIKMERTISLTFARFLGFNEATISARAVAFKNSKWMGDALPFVNLDDSFSPNSQIEAWEKTGPGDFESIWKNDITTINKDTPASLYFDIAFEDGLSITEGVVAEGNEKIKSSVETIYDRVKLSGEPVYILSLSNAVIASQKIYVKRENATSYTLENLFKENGKTDLGNKDIIRPDQLVLLECTFDFFKFNNHNDAKLELTVLKSYTMVGDDYPLNYVEPGGKKAKLVE